MATKKVIIEKKYNINKKSYDLLCSYYHHGENGWGDCNKFHKDKFFKQFIDYYCNCDANDWHVPELNKCLYGQIF